MNNDFNITARYLLNINTVPKELIANYNLALKNHSVEFSSYENKIWKRMLKSRFIFGIYDSGFAFVNPESHIRKRIFIALAILECNHHFTHYFLNETSPLKDFMNLTIQIPIAIFKAVIGGFLVYFKL